ncbi:MAG: OadG family protein [Thiopseudomonas sp.]|nr:OadG family protein [Thiopseudomonas sp.]MCK9464815.1 OadG family protein [Thiopseudomonas sp.]
MTSQLLLLEGVELMLFGLGLVFLFLVLLILCINLIARTLERFAMHEAVTATVVTRVGKSVSCAQVDADTLSAIQLAIQQHRARHN